MNQVLLKLRPGHFVRKIPSNRSYSTLGGKLGGRGFGVTKIMKFSKIQKVVMFTWVLRNFKFSVVETRLVMLTSDHSRNICLITGERTSVFFRVI